MSADRDVTRIVRSWLHEDAYEDADRVLSLVLDELDTTPQRRATWLAWRSPFMSNNVRIALAAAALVLVAVIGIQLFRGPGVGGPGSSPSQSASPTLAPTPTPLPTAVADFPRSGSLAIGRHPIKLVGLQASIEFPTAGWISNGEWGIDRGDQSSPDSASFILWPLSAPDNVFADPCAEMPASPPPGPSAAELATAVSTIPGINLVSGPSEVTVGGYPAQHVVFTVPDEIGCTPDQFYLWEDLDNPGLARYVTQLGETYYIWIIDVNGTIVWIDGETYLSSSADVVQEVQDIVASIRFD